MKPFAYADLGAILLYETRREKLPSDRLFRRFTRARRFLGSKERAALGDFYFHALRHMRRLDEAIQTVLSTTRIAQMLEPATGFPVGDERAALAWTGATRPGKHEGPNRWIDQWRITLAAEEIEPGFLLAALEGLIEKSPSEEIRLSEKALGEIIPRSHDVARHLACETRHVRLPIKHSIPEWLWGGLGFGLSPREMDTMAEGLNKPGLPCLRVNTLKTSIDGYAKALGHAKVPFQQSELVPEGFVIEKRLAPDRLPGIEDGRAAFQDAGSQLVVHAINPQPDTVVVDACAGGGGKTLHLAARMQNRGRLLVYEPAETRLKNLRRRCTDAGVSIVEELSEDAASKEPGADNLAGIVLLDVPCSGTGTIRRAPELKWRLTKRTLQDRVTLQRQLLDRWSAWVRPGGLLAYATCSLLHGENGAQIEAFLARKGGAFEPIELSGRPGVRADMLPRGGRGIQLYPHRHGTDGFFLSILRRTER